MLYGFYAEDKFGRLMTIVTAGDSKDELITFANTEIPYSINFDHQKKATFLEIMKDENFKGLRTPVKYFHHLNAKKRDEFVLEHDITILARDPAVEKNEFCLKGREHERWLADRADAKLGDLYEDIPVILPETPVDVTDQSLATKATENTSGATDVDSTGKKATIGGMTSNIGVMTVRKDPDKNDGSISIVGGKKDAVFDPTNGQSNASSVFNKDAALAVLKNIFENKPDDSVDEKIFNLLNDLFLDMEVMGFDQNDIYMILFRAYEQSENNADKLEETAREYMKQVPREHRNKHRRAFSKPWVGEPLDVMQVPIEMTRCGFVGEELEKKIHELRGDKKRDIECLVLPREMVVDSKYLTLPSNDKFEIIDIENAEMMNSVKWTGTEIRMYRRKNIFKESWFLCRANGKIILVRWDYNGPK